MISFKSKSLHTREILAELAPDYARGRLIDVGAGSSKYKDIFMPYISEYKACDSFEAPHIDKVVDAHDLSYDDEEFDTVICTMVLEHVQKPWVVASELQRVLRSGGHCIVGAPFMFPYHQDPEDYFRFSTAGMASLFDQCEIVRVWGVGGTASLFESCWRICFCSPYKKPHGFLRRNIYRVIRIIFEFIDRHSSHPENLYCNTYIVAKKK
jgi:SAM-dependent methyltransferase